MMEQNAYTIDLDRIVRERSGGRVPGFVVGWLKRLIHQDFLNEFLGRGLEGEAFCRGVLDYVGVTVDVVGQENLPRDGRRYTFVSNHPLGAVDSMTIGGLLAGTYDHKIRFLVNDLLMNLKGLAPLCLPINKLGAQARNLPAVLDSAFASDNHIVLFPAGLCSRRIDGRIQDLEWGKAFVTKSVKAQRDVVPIHFIGENSPRFYRVANLCKWLHLKFNFAMLLLPDEMYHSRGRHYTVRIGKPIPWQTFDRSRTPHKWAQWVRAQVYEI